MTIEVIDSKTYTYIYGHIVIKAAEMREQAETFDAISVVKAVLTAWKPTSVCTASSSSRVRPVFRAAQPSLVRRSVSPQPCV